MAWRNLSKRDRGDPHDEDCDNDESDRTDEGARLDEGARTDEGARLAPSVVRDVLARLNDRGLEATPENFAWMYQQVMRVRGLSVAVQYTNELAALKHATSAFTDLLVGNDWLAGRFRTLVAVIDDTSCSEPDRICHAKMILEDIVKCKVPVLHQAAKLVVETREAIVELVQQVAELGKHVSGGRANLDRALALTVDCSDIDDARDAVHALSRDINGLSRMLQADNDILRTHYDAFVAGVPYLFGLPTVANGEPAPAMG